MRVPILCYHGVSDEVDPRLAEFCVTRRAFASQMGLLRRLGYRTLTLRQLVDAFDSAANLKDVIVLTFDDGYRDTVTVAAPILEEHGFRGTVFVITEMVGARPPAFHGVEMASWAELRSLRDRGWEIGLHSATHQDLTTLDEPALARELVDARQVLEANLGTPVRNVAYPWGKYTPAVVSAVTRSGACAAVTVSHSLATATSNRYALPRCAVRREDSTIDFLLTVHIGFNVRSLLRFARRQGTRFMRDGGPLEDTRSAPHGRIPACGADARPPDVTA